jgi:transcriptional regulator with XRE-family HTH domain
MPLLSAALPDAPRRACVIDRESRSEALGRFLRERREALSPEQVGISSHRGRRTPGLRREEVAFLADIGVKWYARLEAGDEIHPSAVTLTGIAVALRLSNAELEYMLDLAGLRQPSLLQSDAGSIPEPLITLVRQMRGVAVTICDRILTALAWNDVAEAMYGHSRCEAGVERNGLVRGLFDPEFIDFLGLEREQLVAHAVGMFRLNYSSSSPSPFAAKVYERVKDHPLFQRAWQHRIVTNELTSAETTIRNHADVGKLSVYAADLGAAMRNDFLLRILMPADEATEEKFERLARMGREGALRKRDALIAL